MKTEHVLLAGGAVVVGMFLLNEAKNAIPTPEGVLEDLSKGATRFVYDNAPPPPGNEGYVPDYLQGKEGWIPDYLQGKEGWVPDYLQNLLPWPLSGGSGSTAGSGGGGFR